MTAHARLPAEALERQIVRDKLRVALAILFERLNDVTITVDECVMLGIDAATMERYCQSPPGPVLRAYAEAALLWALTRE